MERYTSLLAAAVLTASIAWWGCAASDGPSGHPDAVTDTVDDGDDDGTTGTEICNGYDDDGDTLVDEGFDLENDVHNCGECGNVCAFPNAASSCVAGECVMGDCMPDYWDVNGRDDDGCEYRCIMSDWDGDTEIDTQENAYTCHDTIDNDCDGAVDMFDPDCSDCFDEVCNGYDDDCDELIDEDFDLMTDVLNCGECGTECYSPEFHAHPVCEDGVCGWECELGWVDADGIEANGCEELGCSPGATDIPDAGFSDEDCDGIDGTITRAIFVATTGNNSWPGTQSQPKRDVQAAIDAAVADSTKDHVYVSVGTYNETLVMADDVSVFGGYDEADAWARATDHTVTFHSSDTLAVTANGLVSETYLGFVTVESTDASSESDHSVGIHASGSNGLVLLEAIVVAGRGGSGAGGSTGGPGETYTSYPSMRGTGGGNGCEYGCHCSPCVGCGSCSRPSPGSGGTTPCGTYGGNGGTSGSYRGSGGSGAAGSGGALGGSGGPSTCSGSSGGDGSPGASPAFDSSLNGAGGNGTGSMLSGVWQPSDGLDGSRGLHGQGGGGGGGGGGDCSESCLDGWCTSYGGSGGGGGAGGCGGYSGTGGTGGGASIAVILENSNATLTNCSLSTGGGGHGGAGGNGGSGGAGAPGGLGGSEESYDQGGPGGDGSAGGTGSSGGNGGGGGGGPSIGVVVVGTSTPILGGVLYSLGPGGTGGASSGSAGTPGIATNTQTF